VDCKGGCWIQLADRKFQCRTFRKSVVVIRVKFAERNSGTALYELVIEEPVLLVICLTLWRRNFLSNFSTSCI